MTGVPPLPPEGYDDLLALVDLQARLPPEDPAALIKAALWYASVGWAVFPLAVGGKAPLTAHGCKDASSNEAAVRAWWQQHPLANIGVATGGLFDVIDLDLAPGGLDSFRQFVEELRVEGCPPLDVLAVSQTGRGGRHLLVSPTGRGNRAGLRTGIDYRGEGGYVVVPPSWLSEGNAYVWTLPPSGALAEPA